MAWPPAHLDPILLSKGLSVHQLVGSLFVYGLVRFLFKDSLSPGNNRERTRRNLLSIQRAFLGCCDDDDDVVDNKFFFSNEKASFCLRWDESPTRKRGYKENLTYVDVVDIIAVVVIVIVIIVTVDNCFSHLKYFSWDIIVCQVTIIAQNLVSSCFCFSNKKSNWPDFFWDQCYRPQWLLVEPHYLMNKSYKKAKLLENLHSHHN